jgi:acyl-CoA thioesterase
MHQFDQDTSLTEKGCLTFEGKIADNFSIHGIPNGGYLMSILLNALLTRSEKKSTPILTANYISRCNPGEFEIHVEELVQSNQFNRYQAKLVQKGKERIRMLGTFADEPDECFIRRYEASPPNIPPRERCIPVPEMPRYTLFRNMDIRLDPRCAGWMQNQLNEKSEHAGWLGFKDGRFFDILSIPLAADAFPPAVFPSHGPSAWVPTIEFSVNIRRTPRTGWLKCLFRTRFINCGLMEEDGEVWDESGELLAISRQIAQFRKAG